MKNVFALLGGTVGGVLLFAVLLYVNPFAAPATLSPLAVSERVNMELRYPAVAGESIAAVTGGGSGTAPHPRSLQALREPTVADTRMLVVALSDSRGQPAGLGVKFATPTEDARLLATRLPIRSVWHLWLPGRGSLFIEQVEDAWPYCRKVVIPAHLSSSDSWRGTWYGIMTDGPGALGTGIVTGGSGSFAGMQSEAVEALTARAYAVDGGPVAMDGALTIAIPERR